MGLFFICFLTLNADVKGFTALATHTSLGKDYHYFSSQTGQGMTKSPLATLPELQRFCVQLEGSSSKLKISALWQSGQTVE